MLVFKILLHDKNIWNTKKPIFIPKQMLVSHQADKNEFLGNPIYEQKAAQLTLL